MKKRYEPPPDQYRPAMPLPGEVNPPGVETPEYDDPKNKASWLTPGQLELAVQFASPAPTDTEERIAVMTNAWHDSKRKFYRDLAMALHGGSKDPSAEYRRLHRIELAFENLIERFNERQDEKYHHENTRAPKQDYLNSYAGPVFETVDESNIEVVLLGSACGCHRPTQTDDNDDDAAEKPKSLATGASVSASKIADTVRKSKVAPAIAALARFWAPFPADPDALKTTHEILRGAFIESVVTLAYQRVHEAGRASQLDGLMGRAQYSSVLGDCKTMLPALNSSKAAAPATDEVFTPDRARSLGDELGRALVTLFNHKELFKTAEVRDQVFRQFVTEVADALRPVYDAIRVASTTTTTTAPSHVAACALIKLVLYAGWQLFMPDEEDQRTGKTAYEIIWAAVVARNLAGVVALHEGRGKDVFKELRTSASITLLKQVLSAYVDAEAACTRIPSVARRTSSSSTVANHNGIKHFHEIPFDNSPHSKAVATVARLLLQNLDAALRLEARFLAALTPDRRAEVIAEINQLVKRANTFSKKADRSLRIGTNPYCLFADNALGKRKKTTNAGVQLLTGEQLYAALETRFGSRQADLAMAVQECARGLEEGARGQV